MRASRIALAAAATLAVAGCGGEPQARERSTGALPSSANPTAGPDSNELRLTRAQSLRIVDWATAFHACVRSRGVQLGRIVVGETRIEMKLLPGLPEARVIPATTACAERQGGPPEKVSLQYRPGRVLLYLPKQCLLDEKVASS